MTWKKVLFTGSPTGPSWPCLGPALYRITPREDIQGHLEQGGEFNITLDLDIVQQITKPGATERRVGRCAATFHVTPKAHHKRRRARALPAQRG